jgi:hexosaminidase
MKRLFIALLLFSQVAVAQTKKQSAPSIIPLPVSMKTGTGEFRLTKQTVIAVQDEGDQKAANFLNDFLQQVYGFKLDIDKQEGKNYIRLTTRKFIKAPDKDAYALQVLPEGVIIEGDTYAGTFYGIQSLIQLLPTNTSQSLVNQSQGVSGLGLQIPVVTIQDYPRFSYRSMHLDVGRHFFPVSFIKRYIDYLALHKMNYFHWHLTEDQGWRIEIKKYPELTAVGAYRNGTIIGRYPGTGNDNTRYGGFYSQDEIKDVVQYAANRHITVIPEIEMPGHASAAIATFPWLSCFPEKPTKIPSNPSQTSIQQQAQGKNKLVQETWGVFEDIFCAGNDSTFQFLENVLDEVLTLFPSTYIHVGGDEAPKAHWKKCPRCQARIKSEGLKDEHELQSYFIQRMEKYLNAKGRTLIGWDEILEGGLAPNAIVMSWRGEKGGIEAAKQKHQVIMTPQKPVYFDHTQTRNEDSVTIGGYNPIEAVYAYEPVPAALTGENAKYVMGAQANMWTEYMKNPSKVEYMAFPRMSALSEVLWSPKEKKNWKDFEARLQNQFKRYDLWKTNYSKAYHEIKTSVLPTRDYKGVLWSLQTAQPSGKIDYTWDARSATTPYSTPIKITESRVYSAAYTNGGAILNLIHQNFSINKATGKKITIKTKPNEKYPGQGGAFGLVNGIYSDKGLSSSDWLGWIGDDLEAIIDLGKKETFTTVDLHTIDQNGSWVYLPASMKVLTSTDGKTYKAIDKPATFVKDTLTMGFMRVTFPATTARFVKLVATNYGLIPDGKPGAGNKAWLFADEIQVY